MLLHPPSTTGKANLIGLVINNYDPTGDNATASTGGVNVLQRHEIQFIDAVGGPNSPADLTKHHQDRSSSQR